MTNKIIPSLLIPEIFFPMMGNEKNILDIVHKISDIGFYQCIELGILFDKDIINKVRNIAENNHLKITQWMTFELLKHNLNLASLDKEQRKKSVSRAKELVHIAGTQGTTKLSLVSGPKPESHLQNEAKKYLSESLIELSQELTQYNGLILQIEPLDCFAHKKQLIGLTNDTVDWITSFRKECPNLYIAWDSAHVCLNQEDLTQSLITAAPLISQLHLSNAVLDPNSPKYGDFHMKIGKPGFLDHKSAISILKTARELNIPNRFDELSVAVEVRGNENDDLWKNELECRKFLKNIFIELEVL
ncbi:sugar phosphate isomerase/epimerase family protein [Lonepinella sp. BR2271]|uniref:sugar phosphate isomerase/epimerase family protein n=1 Tax=Lonepinella sp. BR2271 TaxID=3434550 RepID=UPI003F6E106D